MKFNTKTIHGNQKPEETTGAVMPPIFQTSTFVQTSPGKFKDYQYARSENPTRTALENALASIENGQAGFAFGSGMAAIDAVLKLLNPGDEVITSEDIYGGSYRMFTKIYEKYGIKFHFVPGSYARDFAPFVNLKTKLIWLETPTNPLLKIVDIAGIAQLTKDKNIWLAVDNTFASPYNQLPLDLGADIVMHSATKYLGGHSDVIAGALVVKNEELAEKIHFQLFAGGAILGPQDSYLVLRGIKTLGLRMERHAQNAMEVANFLSAHPTINQVFYPGLTHHPTHDLALKQMKTFGGMLSFNLKSGKKEDAYKILENLKIITLAESLGGVESLVNHPATMSHASIPAETRAKISITDDLMRLSVGIEDIDDLLEDLENVLNLI